MVYTAPKMKVPAETLFEERIALETFHSSQELKDEIGLRVRKRLRNWAFVKLVTRGPYLYITFEQKEGQAGAGC